MGLAPGTLERLQLVDEGFMQDVCEIRTRPASAPGGDFGGGGADDSDDTGWAVLTYVNRQGATTAVIPCRVGTVPMRNPEGDVQGRLGTLYTYLVSVPLALMGHVKPGDHVHWHGVIITVQEPRSGTYTTSVTLAGQAVG